MTQDFFSSKLPIIKAMQKANKPLILQHIAERSGFTPQRTRYQIKELAKWGICGEVIEGDKCYYILQDAYYDENLLEALYANLTPFLEVLGQSMDFTQCDVPPPKALVRNLTTILRLFEQEVEKLKLDSKNNLTKKV